MALLDGDIVIFYTYVAIYWQAGTDDGFEILSLRWPNRRSDLLLKK
jgi:hypothetical protein